jgi:hypothetical protein
MRKMIVLVWLILCPLVTGAAEPDASPDPTPAAPGPEPNVEALPPDTPFAPWTHTRALSPSIAALIGDAVERSQVVVSLMKELERSNVVAYVTDSPPWALANPASYMVFLSREAGMRYVLVRINRWGLSPPERIVLLGHELQHALEVAAAPEVQNASGLAQLYQRIGWSGGGDKYESAAAQAVSQKIRRELSRD